MRFEFATAGRIVFGVGTLPEAAREARAAGRRALLVTGKSAARAQRLRESLASEGIEVLHQSISSEPTVADVVEGSQKARAEAVELVIGFGGGSALDAAKAVAALSTNTGDALDYLEVIGRGQPLAQAPLPCIAVPTTAGTGTEVTRNAVLTSPGHRVKVSLRSPLMLPRLALIDPELTFDLPPDLTAATGMDALTQLIEPYVSCRANPMTDSLCVHGLWRIGRSLRRAVEDGNNREAREDMALASLFSGLALANAGLGAVHGFAGPIGGMFAAPHGAVCAALLPWVVEMNLAALHERGGSSPALERYHEVARLLTGRPAARARDGVDWLHALLPSLGIPPLRTYGITDHDVPEIVMKASQASSMKANPLQLTPQELERTLRRAL
jgi:alcohol dehydrogenase class IV